MVRASKNEGFTKDILTFFIKIPFKKIMFLKDVLSKTFIFRDAKQSFRQRFFKYLSNVLAICFILVAKGI